MKGSKVATPAKKASPSLKDILEKKDTAPVADKKDETPKDENGDNKTYITDDGKEADVVKSVGTKPIDKTPTQLSQETPKETAERYDLDNTITDETNADPSIPVYKDQQFDQIESGTHLHPDIAIDEVRNQNLTIPGTDRGSVSRVVTEFAFAGESPNDDKGFGRQDIKAAVDAGEHVDTADNFNRDEHGNLVDHDNDDDDVPPNAGSTF
jgi:hypothetical protein